MKILIPIDGSSYSKNSLEFLVSRKSLLGGNSQIELLVVLPEVSVTAARAVAKDSLTRYYEEEAEKTFAPQRMFLASRDIQVTSSSSGRQAGASIGLLTESHVTVTEVTRVGDPAEKIAEEAERFKADIIIMGSRGLHALAGLFLGSVTNGVLALTKLPILILRNKPAPTNDTLKVGIAVDGSEYGLAAVDYALSHRKLFGKNADMRLISVVSDYTATVIPTMTGMALPTLDEDEIKELQEKEFNENVEPLRKLFKEKNIEPQEVCLVGNPGDELAAYAKNEGLDVIIMGSHGYGRFQSAVMGSTAMRVAAQGDVPILLIRK